MNGKRLGLFVGSDAYAGALPEVGSSLTFDGTSDLNLFWADLPRQFDILTVTKNYFRQSRRYALSPYRLLVNFVTDPGQHPGVLANIAQLLRGYQGRVINHPAAVLKTTRDRVAARLTGIPGLIVPPTLRLRTTKPNIVMKELEKSRIRFPAIVRGAGTHGGKILGLFESAHDIVSALGGASSRGEHIVTSFVDFASADGLYRKYRVFVFGRRQVFRHLLVDQDWNIHASSRLSFMIDRQHLLDEEKGLFETGLPGRVATRIELIRQAVGLDFFGIDFGIMPDGQVVLFEANATMNFFPFMPDPRLDHVKLCIPRAEAALKDLLNAGLTG